MEQPLSRQRSEGLTPRSMEPIYVASQRLLGIVALSPEDDTWTVLIEPDEDAQPVDILRAITAAHGPPFFQLVGITLPDELTLEDWVTAHQTRHIGDTTPDPAASSAALRTSSVVAVVALSSVVRQSRFDTYDAHLAASQQATTWAAVPPDVLAANNRPQPGTGVSSRAGQFAASTDRLAGDVNQED